MLWGFVDPIRDNQYILKHCSVAAGAKFLRVSAFRLRLIPRAWLCHSVSRAFLSGKTILCCLRQAVNCTKRYVYVCINYNVSCHRLPHFVNWLIVTTTL